MATFGGSGLKIKKTGTPGVSGASSVSGVSVPSMWKPAAEPGARIQTPPKTAKFEAADSYRETPKTTQTEFVNLGNIPYIRGQFARNPSDKTKIVPVSRETITGAQKEGYRTGLGSGQEVQIDHMMPVWAGGTAEAENLRPVPEGENQSGALTKAQAVLRILFRNPELAQKHLGRQLDLAETRMWLIRAADFTDKDVKGVGTLTSGGLKDETSDEAVKNAAKVFNKWQERPKGNVFGMPNWLAGTFKAIKGIAGLPFSTEGSKEFAGKVSEHAAAGAKMGIEGLESIPGIGKPLASVVKKTNLIGQGATSALSLGHFTAPPEPDETSADRLARTSGQILGGVVQWRVGGELIAKGVTGGLAKIAPKFAAKYFPVGTANAVTAAKGFKGRWQSMLKRLPANIVLMGATGQLSRQEENTAEARIKALGYGSALAVPASLARPGFTKDLMGLWMGVGAIEAASGVPYTDAAINATAFTIYHATGDMFGPEAVKKKASQIRVLPAGVGPTGTPVPQIAEAPIRMKMVTDENGNQRAEMEVVPNTDPNLTPEQRRAEDLRNVLIAKQEEYATLSPEERAKREADDYRTAQEMLNRNPQAFSGMSQAADDASQKVIGTPAVVPVEGEPAHTVPLKKSKAVDLQVKRATDDGTLLPAQGLLVPADGTRAVMTLRDDGLPPEVVLVSEKGDRYPLGTIIEDIGALQPVKDFMPVNGVTEVKILVSRSDGTVTVTMTESLNKNSSNFGKAVKAEEATPAKTGPTSKVRVDQPKSESNWLQTVISKAVGKPAGIVPPISNEAFINEMTKNVSKGKLSTRAIQGMNLRQLGDAIDRTADSVRGGTTLRERKALAEQAKKLVTEIFNKAESPEEADAIIAPLMEKVRKAVSPPVAGRDTDPTVLENVGRAVKMLGAKTGQEANELGLKLTIVRRMLKTDPKAEKPAVSRFMSLFGKPKVEPSQATLPLDQASEMDKMKERMKSVKLKDEERAARTPKEIIADRRAATERAKHEIDQAIEPVEKLRKEKYYGTENPEKVVSDYETRLNQAVGNVIADIKNKVDVARNRYEESGERMKGPKVSAKDISGYSGMTDADIEELQRYGENAIRLKKESTDPSEDLWMREKGKVFNGEEYIELPYNRKDNQPEEETSAMDFFEANVENRRISGTPEEYYALRRWFVHGDSSGVLADKFMMFMPEFNPDVKAVNGRFDDYLAERGQYGQAQKEGRESEMKKPADLLESDRNDYMRAMIAGQADERTINYSVPSDKEIALKIYVSDHPRNPTETPQDHKKRVTDGFAKAWKAKEFTALPKNPRVAALPEVKEALLNLPHGDVQASKILSGKRTLLTGGKRPTYEEYDLEGNPMKDEEGNVIRRDITNPVALHFRSEATKAKSPALGEMWKRAEKKLADAKGGESAFYENQMVLPGQFGENGVDFTTRMHPSEAKVVQLASADVLDLYDGNDPIVAAVAKVAKEARDSGRIIYASTKPNESLKEFEGQYLNIRNIAALEYGRTTPDGEFMLELAGNDADKKRQVEEWLMTGKYGGEDSQYLDDEMSSALRDFHDELGGRQTGKLELRPEEIGRTDPNADVADEGQQVTSLSKTFGEYDEDFKVGVELPDDLVEYTSIDLRAGALIDKDVQKKLMADSVRKETSVDKVAEHMAGIFDRKYQEALDAAIEEASTQHEAEGQKAEEKATHIATLEKELETLKADKEKAKSIQERGDIAEKIVEKEYEIKGATRPVPYRSPNMTRHSQGEKAPAYRQLTAEETDKATAKLAELEGPNGENVKKLQGEVTELQSMGDLSENAAFKSAKGKLGTLLSDIEEKKRELAAGKVEPGVNPNDLIDKWKKVLSK